MEKNDHKDCCPGAEIKEKLAALFTKERTDKIVNEIKTATDELGKMAKAAKEKYDKTDEETKKKILIGVAGATALIAGLVGMKKMHDKKGKEK